MTPLDEKRRRYRECYVRLQVEGQRALVDPTVPAERKAIIADAIELADAAYEVMARYAERVQP